MSDVTLSCQSLGHVYCQVAECKLRQLQLDSHDAAAVARAFEGSDLEDEREVRRLASLLSRLRDGVRD